MGTSGLTIVRERKAKRGNKTSALGGPSESQYFINIMFVFINGMMVMLKVVV